MKNKFYEVNTCEVCGNNQLLSVLDLGSHPMCDDLVPVADARVCREYPIEILFCQTCLTAHQRFQVPKQDLFPSSYHYRSRFTADVLSGMKNLVASCSQQFGGLSGKKVLDIGCNDGSLLSFFREQGATTIGVEPTGACEDAKQKGHVIYQSFLSGEVADQIVTEQGQPDFISFTNVFAHIEDLSDVLRSLKILMGEKTILVIENHYLGAVLEGNQFDTFYHEHPRTYSYTSFVHIARTLGVNLLDVEFPSRYGGNIRVFLGANLMFGKSSIDRKQVEKKESAFLNDFSELKNKIEHWHTKKLASILKLVQEYGPLKAKAFPGRAAILVKLLGLNEEHISVVYEKPGSMKIDHYLPGTRIPICSDEQLLALPDKSQPLLNLAWHISKEIKAYLTKLGYTGQVVDILGPDDFLEPVN